jgi:hypothetical protein
MLDGWPAMPEAGEYGEGREDLTHVPATLGEFDRHGGLEALWLELRYRWPIFADAEDAAPQDRAGTRQANVVAPKDPTAEPTSSRTAQGTADATTEAATAIDAAIGLLAKHPDWTDFRIAKAAGCTPPNLSKSGRYQAAREAIKKLGEEGSRHNARHRGADMDQYADEDD